MHRIRSWARTKAHGATPLPTSSRQPTAHSSSNGTVTQPSRSLTTEKSTNDNVPFPSTTTNGLEPSQGRDVTSGHGLPTGQASQAEAKAGADNTEDGPKKKNIAVRFYHTTRSILFSNYFNILLVFVPVGIAVDVANLNPTIVFVMNAIAIVPLAGLLSHATESVAKRMGDTIGALLNVTFGNAVELIIFIALSKDEIRIVQASLLGSILANLLLILGMCFLIGGLRFREQIYNCTVTQMSACLLSLSVMSLLLPTAFHAAYADNKQDEANTAVVRVSRGTSVILLIVYGMYLLFQLKSHAYMYESTPQHVIDEESAPGPVAAWMDSSSSDGDSSSGSDTDGSHDSNTTAGRIKRVMRGGRKRRKSSAGSKDTSEVPSATRSTSYGADINSTPADDGPSISQSTTVGHRLGAIAVADEPKDHSAETNQSNTRTINNKHEGKSKHKNCHDKKKGKMTLAEEEAHETALNEKMVDGYNGPRRVDFAVAKDIEAQTVDQVPKRPFTLRGMSIRPALPTVFAPTLDVQGTVLPPVAGPIPRVRYGIRHTNSLPDRLNLTQSGPRASATPVSLRQASSLPVDPADVEPEEENISRTTAVVLLLVSTGLVALCAEFMVSSINDVTTDTALSETFVGLIILPIVGNAAEHVTAVTVAHKNKMDLAIGVAVGSSIQIALFVTPFIVLLGWCMGKDMSLYFTLFETVSLFVSAFIVNFLVLDGRSNYLEGALLCSAYVIIAVAAFFYPALKDQSVVGGNAGLGT